MQDIAFANATHGWAVLDSGTILATSDGRHWHVQWSAEDNVRKLGSPATFFGLARVGATHLWAAGGYGAGAGNALMLATVNGGRTWRVESSKLSGGFMAVAACDPQHAWTTEAEGVLTTHDGGRTWKYMGARGRIWTSVQLSGLACANPSRGWAVGDYGGPYHTWA